MICLGPAATTRIGSAGRARSHSFARPAAALLLALLTACARATPPPSAATAVPSQTAIPRAAQIRFALIGSVTNANVWALFDKQGYSYNDYAIRSGYWPRLYRLSIPDHQFEAVAADGMPAALRQEGAFYIATVALHPELAWSDGSPFTADDVAFTVNTALSFQLGFDWHDYYDPAWLDHAEAQDTHTVKFFFKHPPSVGTWQYGVLQGPIVQQKYWSQRIKDSAALLPPPDLSLQFETLKARIADLQEQVNALNAAAIASKGEQARQIQADLKRRQGDLDETINDLAKAQAGFDEAMNAARGGLYTLNDQGEPHLGAWTGSPQSGTSTNAAVENSANLNFPGGVPSFDRAVYRLYPTREAAMTALRDGEVDVILDPNAPAPTPESSGGMSNPTREARFLAFNPQSGAWTNGPLRQALACMIDQQELVRQLAPRASVLSSFVFPQEVMWYNPQAALPCRGLDAGARLQQATQILKAAGLTWVREPSPQAPGEGLAAADGTEIAALKLIVPASDELKTAAASYVQQQARWLGIPLTETPVASDAVNFAVFSSHRYDLALLGWRVSAYPGYLCEWFGAGKPFEYSPGRVTSVCSEFDVTSDLERARQQVFEIQFDLVQDLPFIPLYGGATYDAFRSVAYPFTQALGGLSESYGAPSLAIPALP